MNIWRRLRLVPTETVSTSNQAVNQRISGKQVNQDFITPINFHRDEVLRETKGLLGMLDTYI